MPEGVLSRPFAKIKIILINGSVPILLTWPLEAPRRAPCAGVSPPPAGSCLIDRLWFLFPLCCQSMVLMSFWLCNALRSNASQRNLSWHCVQLMWQSLGSLFFSKVVIFLMSWNPCLGVDICFTGVLCCFWILKRFWVSVPCLLWEQLPVLHILLSVSFLYGL